MRHLLKKKPNLWKKVNVTSRIDFKGSSHNKTLTCAHATSLKHYAKD